MKNIHNYKDDEARTRNCLHCTRRKRKNEVYKEKTFERNQIHKR